MDRLTISEVFGPTFQGEGPSAGRQAMFLRLGLCNLSCSYCDTPYTWDWTGKNGEPQDKSLLVRQAIDDLVKSGVLEQAPLLVITGGEPLLQQRALEVLVAQLPPWLDVEIETNGTIVPSDVLAFYGQVSFNVSPKLDFANAATNAQETIVPRALRAFVESERAVFKFVCAEPGHVDDVEKIVEDIGIDPATVWIMPEGRSGPAIVDGMKQLAAPALAAGFNLTSRLHVLVWDDERGH